MAFTAKDVQALRESTGAGMMDCKKALTETDGDMQKAVEYLREKGMSVAAKKAGRIAAEGMVFAAVCDECGVGAMVEVNSETDFVAKNESFVDFVENVCDVVSMDDPADVAKLLECEYPDSEFTVGDMLREKVLTIGENIQIRRFERYPDGVNVAYVHMGGKIGVLVNLEVENIKDMAAVNTLGRDIAMQIAAMSPKWLDRSASDPEVVAKEKEILLAQALGEGKPQNVAEKMVEGRINKYFEDMCLLDQAYVKENKVKVLAHINAVAADLGGTIKVKKFARFEKGEGIAKREDNFAEEVSKMTK